MFSKIFDWLFGSGKKEEVDDSKVPAAWPFPTAENRPTAPVSEEKPKAKQSQKPQPKKHLLKQRPRNQQRQRLRQNQKQEPKKLANDNC